MITIPRLLPGRIRLSLQPLPRKMIKMENGIPDSQENLTVDLDNDSIPDMDQLDIIKSQDMVTGNGQMGISRRYDATITAIESILPLDAEDISHYSRPSNMPLGLFGFRLTVATPGDTAEVTVYFSEAASEDATWYLYDTIRGWVDFSNYITFDSRQEVRRAGTEGPAVMEMRTGLPTGSLSIPEDSASRHGSRGLSRIRLPGKTHHQCNRKYRRCPISNHIERAFLPE